ncbi:hypothetical protein L208DRAFT_1386911 [Tricholoma matsutake]|nr:hypothetical protein L208DRAFT_1386911 [Tricholoma matsutake 945]
MSTVQVIRSSVETFTNGPARGPQPKDIYEAQQWEMAGAHACIMNGLLNIYEKANTVQASEAQNFVEYALLWYAAIDHHHTWEEKIYYPLFNPKFSTDFIVAEHETFHAGVESLKEYLISCLPAGAKWGYGNTVGPHKQETFEGNKLCSLIDAFVNELSTHLIQEITYLEPAKTRASGLTEAEVRHIASVSEKHMKTMPPFTFLTYLILHTPKVSEFPPVPGFVKNVLAPYIFYQPNRKLWKFAPKA